MKQINIKGVGMSDDMEVTFNDERVDLVIPMQGSTAISDPKIAKQLAKALKAWADWTEIDEH